MVESNLQATATATDFDSESQSQPLRETFGDARRNILHLRSQTESWFAVLFNVFGSVGQEGKGMVGDVISAWVKIAGDQVCFPSSLTHSHGINNFLFVGNYRNV